MPKNGVSNLIKCMTMKIITQLMHLDTQENNPKIQSPKKEKKVNEKKGKEKKTGALGPMGLT